MSSFVIKKKSMWQWILIFLLFQAHDSALYIVYNTAFTAVSLLTIFYVGTRYGYVRSKRIAIALLLLLTDVFFVRILNSGGIGLGIFIRWATQLLLAYVAVEIDSDYFIDRFSKFVTFMAVVSLLFYVVSLSNTSIIKAISLFQYSPWEGATHYGGLLYTLTTGYTRNTSVFNEPGLYQIVLNSALFFMMFYQDRIYCKERTKTYMAAVLIITLLTTQSTNAYLGMLVIILCYMFQNKQKNAKFKIVLAFMILFGVLIVDFAQNGESSLFYRVVLKKLSEINHDTRSDYIVTSGQARWITIQMCMQSIIKHPLGIGIDKYNLELRRGFLHADVAVAAVLFSMAAQIGVVPVVIMVRSFLKKIWRNKECIASFIAVSFLFFNTLLGQSDFFYPAIWILMFACKKGRIIHESTLDVQSATQPGI